MNHQTVTEIHPCRMFSADGILPSKVHLQSFNPVRGGGRNSLVDWFGGAGCGDVGQPMIKKSRYEYSSSPSCYPLSVLAEYVDRVAQQDIVKAAPPPAAAIENSDDDEQVVEAISRNDFNWNIVLVDKEQQQETGQSPPSSSSPCDVTSTPLIRAHHHPRREVQPDHDEEHLSISREGFDWTPDIAVTPFTVISTLTNASLENRNQDSAAVDYDDRNYSISNKREVRALPVDFEPLPYSVVVGKCKEALGHSTGNARLRVLASNYVSKYAKAMDTKDKKAKTEIVSILVETIRNACPMGAFIRLGKDGRWYPVSESVAREKVGYAL